MGAVPLRLVSSHRHPSDGPAQAVVVAGPWSLHVVDAALACCAVEFEAALCRLAEAGPVAAATPGAPRRDVLVVSGTVTAALAPVVLARYDEFPIPPVVVSFGACANSGGPYWDSYCVTKGVDQLLPVDLYVPGCPPRPEALLDALAGLMVPVPRTADGRVTPSWPVPSTRP